MCDHQDPCKGTGSRTKTALELSKLLLEELTSSNQESQVIIDHSSAIAGVVKDQNNLNSAAVTYLVNKKHKQPLVLQINGFPL